MELIRFSDKPSNMDEGGTLTVFLSENSCIKMSAADIIGMFQRLVGNEPCRKNKIPSRVVSHISGQIESISGFVDAMSEKVAERESQTDLVEESTEQETGSCMVLTEKKRKTGPRVSKHKKATLLSFLKQFVTTAHPNEEFDCNEIISLIGNVQMEKVLQFINKSGYRSEAIGTQKIRVSISK